MSISCHRIVEIFFYIFFIFIVNIVKKHKCFKIYYFNPTILSFCKDLAKLLETESETQSKILHYMEHMLDAYY